MAQGIVPASPRGYRFAGLRSSFREGCKQPEDALTGQELFAFMVHFEHAVQDVQDGDDGLAA